jgi:glycosyltransferase involved in cell wall biosynthesis
VSAPAVTHFVENLDRGGLERTVIDLVRTQLARGQRCQVVCLFERGALAGELDALGVPVLACGKRRGADLRALARARHNVVAHGSTILHTHNAAAHYHAVLATLGLGLRTINTRHGMGALDATSRRERLYRLSLRRTAVVATVCEAARRELERGWRHATQLVAVPNGIDVGRFAPRDEAARERLVATLGLPPSTRVVGTVGRLNRVKDHAGLLQAFARLQGDVPDAVLVVAGDGELRAELAALAATPALAGRVHLLGDRSDVADLLRAFDLFVMSSRSEGYSIALLEACASALPIVATDVGGNAEIVHAGENGLLLPPGDPVALADALRMLLADPLRARAMGQAGLEWVGREGSLAAMAARYEQLYEGRAEVRASAAEGAGA